MRRRRTAPRPPRAPRGVPDPVTRYARAVVSGRIVAGQLVRWQCARHLEDLRTGKARGLRFDRARAWRAIEYFHALRYVEGDRGGQYIELLPWQQFIVGSLLGWMRGPVRRFRQAYIEVSKKQGKSLLGAGLGLLLTFDDGELGAKGFAAATTREQAKIVHGAACQMVALEGTWRRSRRVHKYVISDAQTASSFTCVGARENSLEGLNSSFVILDELHLHPTDAVLEVMRRGQRSRKQPMLVMITTAGWDRTSCCWREREYARKVLDPEHDVEDDRHFVYIATLDEGDDYHDEKCWLKAMPSLGVSVGAEEVRADVARADAEPEQVPPMLQKVFNLWVSNAVERPIDMDAWRSPSFSAPVVLEQLRGRACYLGLDLARVQDLSSLVAVFPPISEGETYKALGWHFCPEENIRVRSRRDRVPYEAWWRAGHLIGTPGDVTDIRVIQAKVLEVARLFRVQLLAYDPTFAPDVARAAQEAGIEVMEHFQGYAAMSLPCSDLLRLVKSARIQHGGDPVLEWSAGNLVMRSGPAARLMPDKERSRDKIDPMVALIMAVGRAATAPPPAPRGTIRTLGG